MSPFADFGETCDVAITLLVDNQTDLLAKSTDDVKYHTGSPLIAEHGFAAWIDLQALGLKILWDSGASGQTLVHNMQRLQIAPAAIDRIALSHGHDDHTSGVTAALAAAELAPKERKWERGTPIETLSRYAQERRVPIIVHPAAFRERWSTPPDGDWRGPIAAPPRAEWQAAGGDIVLSAEPYCLAPGCWTTGAIPHTSFETAGFSAANSYRQDQVLLPDTLDDDQAILLNVKDKGLVILTGCAHAGIVNTVRYAREISGVDQVWAILGGFHLAKATDADIRQTVAEIERLEPRLVMPSHCTGFRAVHALAAQTPDAFRQSLVGAVCRF